MKILITGASGFVGQSLVPILQQKHHVETVSLRKKKVEDLDLKNTEVIVHLAGMAHQMTKIDPKIYFDVNRDLTLKVAEKAKADGVKQFIFISSVKVYGDTGRVGQVLNENSECTPTDPYGKSKLEAEIGLQKLETPDFKVAIIRPPLIYGKEVKGNLQRLKSLILKMPILPFGGIKNERSMVYVGNLIALIDHLIQHQNSGIFIAGDQKAHSTTDLVVAMKQFLNAKTRLVKLPNFAVSILRLLKPALINRLFDSYVIDNSLTNKKLNFQPPFPFEKGIKEMVKK